MKAAALALVALAACGQIEAAHEEAKTDNLVVVPTACEHALACGIFGDDLHAACDRCFAQIDDRFMGDLETKYGKLPPFEKVPCALFEKVIREGTNFGECVDGDWFKEKP